MTRAKRIGWPLGAGLVGAGMLSLLYFGIVSWAESPRHAVELFWQDRWIIVPIIFGFGVQTSLFVILKKRLFLPVDHTGPGGALTGASGGMSAVAMVACCAHHVSDVLPILGLTVAATFLAEYRTAFMLVGLGTTLLGISVMMGILLKERRQVQRMLEPAVEVS